VIVFVYVYFVHPLCGFMFGVMTLKNIWNCLV